MKTKWYLFFLTIITISIILYNFFGVEKSPTYKIGVLMIGDSRYEKYTGIKRGLLELGYAEKDFSFDVKNAKDDPERLVKQIDEILNQDIDLIVTLGGIETVELKDKLEKQGADIPVVFAGVAAPKEIGLIKDYQSPGGNFTGINNYHTSISGKRLEMLHDLVPDIKRVFALYDGDIEISRLSLDKTIEAAKILSMEVVPCNVSDLDYMVFIEEEMKKGDALFMLPSYRIEALTEEIVQFSRKHQLPVMGLYEHEVESGYVASYGTSFYDQGYQAARFISSILQGNSPSQLPVELPDTMRFLVNKQVIDQFGIEMNKDLTYIGEFILEDRKGEEK